MTDQEWDLIASGDLASVHESILAGSASGKPWAPDRPSIQLPMAETVLDLGCGLGRNWPLLQSFASHVVAFDRPAMLKRAPSTPGIVPTSAWAWVCATRYDLVYASLVIQHLEPQRFLHDLWTRTRYLYVHGRSRHDNGGSTWQRIHWPVIRATPGFDPSLRDESHFDVLYQGGRVA